MTDMTPEELKEALELAQCYRFIADDIGNPFAEALGIMSRALLYYLKPKPIAEWDKNRDGQEVFAWRPQYEVLDRITPSKSRFNPEYPWTHFYPLPPAPEGE